MFKSPYYIIVALLIGTLTACAPKDVPTPNADDEDIVATAWAAVTIPPTDTPIPTPTPEPPSILTVCMGHEPSSLFMFADTSASARGIRQAIYDGPYDINNGRVDPVILQQIPSLENGGAELHPVEVQPGTVIMDAFGNWASLQEGTSYRPSGCLSEACAQVYTGDQSASMDELIVRFELLPGISWSDGSPLTTDDSVFGFEIAKKILGNKSAVIRFTQTYLLVDEQTVEWRGIPGFQGAYSTNFFSPLPRHLWGNMTAEELLTSDLSTRTPLGWGPYTIVEWTPGDHITLNRNENYFRAGEGLPGFDHLVFRFVGNGQDAIDALLVGECDYVDHTALDYEHLPRLLEVQSNGHAETVIQQSGAWEQAVFGIASLNEDRLDLFSQEEVRQAIAMCIDRQAIVDQLFAGYVDSPDTILSPEHVQHNPDVASYAYDPEEALKLLASVGWVDYDQDIATPLTSIGIPGLADGTEFEFDYLVPVDDYRQEAAGMITESLAQCGIKANLEIQEWDQFLSPGPEGSVFGRRFDMTQFAWDESQPIPCFLYLGEEIPGPSPDFERGWGGVNLAGYINSEFDQACRTALTTLPDSAENQQANDATQEIFADDLPSLPLYWIPTFSAMRTDMCLGSFDGERDFNLAMIEFMNYGKNCEW